MGNMLLGFALECMTILAIYDGLGLLEHPREPEPRHMVSIWRLPIVQLLLLLPRARLVHLSQGLLGAPSPKPTTLLTVGLPDLEGEILAARLTPELPQGRSVGKDSEGGYRTAPLKEYPPAMCGALAKAFYNDLSSLCTDPEIILPSEFLALIERMQDHSFGTHIGHDG